MANASAMPDATHHLSTSGMRLAFHGGSMRGTFRDGDCLWIACVPFDSLQAGDIVAFRDGDRSIAHRLMRHHTNGWITRGDSNATDDAPPLSQPSFIGKVIGRERAGLRAPVIGGEQGLRRWRRLQAMAWGRRVLFRLLAPPYRLLRTTRLVTVLWHPNCVRLRLTGKHGPFIKYLHGNRTVACWFLAEQRWSCRKPYDLVLTPPKAIPTGGATGSVSAITKRGYNGTIVP